MKNSRCNAIRVSLILGAIVLASNSWAQQRPPIVQKLADTYGLQSFAQVDAIRYTWSATFPGVNISRSWTWEPKTGQVTYEGKDKGGKPVKVTYKRSELASQPDNVKKDIDPGFINDNYWLLLPLHIYWDKSATVTDQSMQKLPIGKGTAQKVVVKYPSGVGYTPGDTWTLWLGTDGRIQEFRYDREGPVKPSVVIATWAGYKQAGGLLFSTEHRGNADGAPLHLWFTNVAVKMAGSDKWVDAK
jgi:hypothetical protein